LAAELCPDPPRELIALPQTPSCIRGGDGWEMGMKEKRKGKESQKAKRKERSRERGETWNNVVCVPFCLSALLATI